MEFRLGLLHTVRSTEYQRNYDAWVASRLLGIFFAVSTGKLTEQSRDGNLEDARKALQELYALSALDYHTKTRQDEEKEKASDMSKEQYVSTLGSHGAFTGVDEIMSAMQGLNEVIESMRKKVE